MTTLSAPAPTPTYAIVIGVAAGGADERGTATVVSGPPRKAVSPVGVMRDRVAVKVSAEVNTGTVRFRSTSLLFGLIWTTVSRAMVLEWIRESRTRTRSMVTMPAAEDANDGARENC